MIFVLLSASDEDDEEVVEVDDVDDDEVFEVVTADDVDVDSNGEGLRWRFVWGEVE